MLLQPNILNQNCQDTVWETVLGNTNYKTPIMKKKLSSVIILCLRRHKIEYFKVSQIPEFQTWGIQVLSSRRRKQQPLKQNSLGFKRERWQDRSLCPPYSEHEGECSHFRTEREEWQEMGTFFRQEVASWSESWNMSRCLPGLWGKASSAR